MSKLEENIKGKIQVKVSDLGYEIEYVELVKEGVNNIARVVIDKTGASLTTDDCEKVSKAIEDDVDKIVKFNDGYILEISSAGLEKKLKNIELYKKYIGENIRLSLYKKIGDKKEYEGILKEVSEDKIIVLETGSGTINVDINDIAMGNTIYNFKEEK